MSAKKAPPRIAKPKKPAAKSGGAPDVDGPGVKAWLEGITPEQRRLARRVDALILEVIPEAVSAVKFRKPSEPLGVPFYGLPGKGWIVHVNSLKERVRLTFYAGEALKPSPPLPAPRGARAIDVPAEAALDEKQIHGVVAAGEGVGGLGPRLTGGLWVARTPDLSDCCSARRSDVKDLERRLEYTIAELHAIATRSLANDDDYARGLLGEQLM